MVSQENRSLLKYMPLSLKILSSIAVILFGVNAFAVSEQAMETLADEAVLLNILADEAQYQLTDAVKSLTDNPKNPNWRSFCYNLGFLEGVSLGPLYTRHNAYSFSERLLHDEALNGRYNELQRKLYEGFNGRSNNTAGAASDSVTGISKICSSKTEQSEDLRKNAIESVNLLLSTLKLIELESQKNFEKHDIE